MAAPKSGTLRAAFTCVAIVVWANWPRLSGREAVAVTLSSTRWMFASWVAGTGPFAQSYGVFEPFMYTVNIDGTPASPGRRTSATRSVVPPLLPTTPPVMSP